jgi:tRNA-dihydrouridine synthase A
MLVDADRAIFGDARAAPDRAAVARASISYLETVVAAGGKPTAVTRHLLSLFRGRPGGRAWRRVLSEGSLRSDAGAEVVAVVERALAHVEAAASGEADRGN